MTKVSMTIDGVRYDDEVEPRMLLVHYLRDVAGRTGTPVGCDTSNCGACTVLLMPRWIQAQRVTFKYGLGAEFIGILRTLHQLGLDRTDPVRVAA